MSNLPAVKCECGRRAELVDHGTRKVWECNPCQAWVGVIPTSPTYQPLGRLADAELRFWKHRANDAFKALWEAAWLQASRSGKRMDRILARAEAFKWLAGQMRISSRDCNFDLMTIEQCRKAFNICEAATSFLPQKH